MHKFKMTSYQNRPSHQSGNKPSESNVFFVETQLTLCFLFSMLMRIFHAFIQRECHLTSSRYDHIQRYPLNSNITCWIRAIFFRKVSYGLKQRVVTQTLLNAGSGFWKTQKLQDIWWNRWSGLKQCKYVAILSKSSKVVGTLCNRWLEQQLSNWKANFLTNPKIKGVYWWEFGQL